MIIDALFGFHFMDQQGHHSDVVIDKLIETKPHHTLVSVDIPSAWDVNMGPVGTKFLSPEMLISLTAPKGCSSYFKGIHYLAGNFIPPKIRENTICPVPIFFILMVKSSG
eukprot:gnl/Chilomastix_caulleri/4130.p1 GENE.gnl/Chilomastix_caulleri/4130~~gnl/Chilomastix_caulleri/4130.p1  ORF type:complete len:110 (+),score=17.57 gnl/Chilomastix_caulleri/4130:48-377(+)